MSLTAMPHTWLHDIDPIAVPLPFWPHGIHWYGLMYLAGFLLGWWLGAGRARAGRLPGVSADAFADLMFYAILGVVVGGRIWYVLFYATGSLIDDPLLLFRINEGGMSFHGGLIGVMMAVAYWSWRHRLHLFDTMDFIAPLVPPGLFFGRIGNFIGSELWGKYTDAGWGVVFPNGLPAQFDGYDMQGLHRLHESGALDAYARHPSQLYEAALEGSLMFAVMWWFSRQPRRRYAVSGLFALLYGCFRIAIEFVRVPDAQLGYLAFGWVTMGQLQSLPLVMVGLWLLWLSRRAPILEPQPMAPESTSADSTSVESISAESAADKTP